MLFKKIFYSALIIVSVACGRTKKVLPGEIVTTKERVTLDTLETVESTPEMEWVGEDRGVLQRKFVHDIGLKYSTLDSVKSGPTEFDINFVAEFFYKEDGKREAALYLLEIDKVAQAGVKGRAKLIGKHNGTIQSIQAPGDFYYYLMTLQQQNDLASLQLCIRDAGYSTTISDGDYYKEKTIKRDSVDFENLGMQFDLYNVNFTFNLSIEKDFVRDGEGGFSYSGGGFYHAILIKKENEKVYLERYNFNGH